MPTKKIRILFITRHYPPMVSGGCRRAHLMVKALRTAGVDVTVMAPLSNGEPQTIIVKHPQPEADLSPPSQGITLRSLIRTHLFYPDPDIRWSLRAAKQALELWPEGFDWVITSSPPESAHVAGMRLSKVWGCKWMADFRDFWLLYPLYAPRENPIRRAIERRFAKIILKRASLLTSVSENMAEEINAISRKDVFHLPNFVEVMKQAPINLGSGLPEKGIHLLYSGAFTLSDSGRFLKPTLQTFERALKLNPNIYLHIAGPLTDLETAEIGRSPATKNIKLYGRLPYELVRRMQAGAHALLIAASEGTITVPGKLEEYQSTGLPIIAIGSGPWVKKTGFMGDPVQVIAQLNPGATAQKNIYLNTPDDAAEQILKWMHAIP